MSKSSKHVVRETAVIYPARSGSDLDLEFPDWSGHIERPSKMSPDEMLRYCESVLPLVRKHPGHRRLRLMNRCYVEFHL
ncbi:MAG: hypothetical protein FJ388_02025 [Verrucomicrobia bacterium]|nr:hypothetical protein [Verrucomicrobiota bacterium]